MPDRKRRFIYNCDADNIFDYDDPPMSPDSVRRAVDEVADTDVTTFFASPNAGMDMNYPGVAGELAGSHAGPEEEAHIQEEGKKKGTSYRGVLNIRSLVAAGHDPLGLILERCRERGLETFVSFRMNECHYVEQPESFLVSRFWNAHPEWHIGKPGDPLPPLHTKILGPVHPIVASWIPGALNFAVPEVRAMVFAQLTEILDRYDLDGLDLDFQRFPIYFPFGEEERHIPVMTAFVREIRALTNEAAKRRGHAVLLAARIMEEPAQNAGIGLDPVGWAREGLLDFVTVSHYLRNTHSLPIGDFRPLFPPDMPIYGSIEFERAADRYREIGRQLWKDGADGIMLFNFFASREGGNTPPMEVLNELGESGKIPAGA